MTALRPLTPNETVAENYGPICLMKSKPERQRALTSRYWFKCDCLACQQDWPTLKQMDYNEIPRLRCPNKSCSSTIKCFLNKDGDKMWAKTCSVCHCKIDNYEMLKRFETLQYESMSQYQAAANLMEQQEDVEASKLLCKAINIFYEFARAPHKETMTAQESLRSCMAIQGNVRIVP